MLMLCLVSGQSEFTANAGSMICYIVHNNPFNDLELDAPILS